MSPSQLLHDDVIEAIVDDRPVDPRLGALVTFSRQVRALGEGPVPTPSRALESLLAGPAGIGTDPTPTARMPALRRPAGGPTRMGGRRRLATRLVLATSLATAGVVGAGAAGILPAAANDTVRGAIEAVTPVRFPPGDGEPATGDDPGPDAPAEPEPSATAGAPGPGPDTGTGPGAHPGPDAPDGAPGQTGDTGLTRADQTPAAPHTPDSTPSATAPGQVRPGEAGPVDGRHPDDPGDPGDPGGSP